jgi:DNA-binding response OmpR family regulator
MLTALVVDDDPSTRLLLRRMLTLLECSSIEAINGVEGERMALDNQPDVILLDLMMPIQDGYETCRNLRAQGYMGTVILVSALDEAAEKARTAACGANAYIQKPVSREVLRMHISHIQSKELALP